MTTRLSKQPLWEQRRGIEDLPGSAGNPELLDREALARLVIVGSDVRLLGPEPNPLREYDAASINPVVAGFPLLAISSPAGFRLHRVKWTPSGGLIRLRRFETLADVLALAGFAASGSVQRSGFNQSPSLQFVTGTSTAAPGNFGIVSLVNGTDAWDPPLWVPPGVVLALYSDTANTTFLLSFDVSEPITYTTLP